jgi:hypothetical protein
MTCPFDRFAERLGGKDHTLQKGGIEPVEGASRERAVEPVGRLWRRCSTAPDGPQRRADRRSGERHFGRNVRSG